MLLKEEGNESLKMMVVDIAVIGRREGGRGRGAEIVLACSGYCCMLAGDTTCRGKHTCIGMDEYVEAP